MKLIEFKPEETTDANQAFQVARLLLFTKCFGIHGTVKALVRLGTSELYAKSVVVHLMAKQYLVRP